jgi:RNA polymerase-binding transcription factor DksA
VNRSPKDWRPCANCGQATAPANLEFRDGFEYCVDCIDEESDFPDSDEYDSNEEDMP